jgi:hypothetical protein
MWRGVVKGACDPLAGDTSRKRTREQYLGSLKEPLHKTIEDRRIFQKVCHGMTVSVCVIVDFLFLSFKLS